jgi:hypothetical protein
LATAAGTGYAGTSPPDQAANGLGSLFPITAAEKAVGITQVNHDVPPPYPERYGASGDGATNDQLALVQCLKANNCVILSPGRTYLINGLTLDKPHATIQGSGGAGFIIAEGPGNFGLHFVSPAGNKKHFNTGFVGRDFVITCQGGNSKITGIFADNAEIVLLENVIVSLAGNHYKGSSVGDGSIAFWGYFHQDGVFVKCAFTGGGGAFGDGVHLTGSVAANETPNNNYFLACRAQSCGGCGVRIRIGDGNVWRGGKIQDNRGGGWIEGDDGSGGGPSNSVIADMGFEANYGSDLTLNICSRIRVHDCTFQSTTATSHILETRYSLQGYFQRNMSFAGKPVRFEGTGTDNVWDFNNGFGVITSNDATFSIDTFQVVTLDFAASIATDCSKGYHFLISATNGTNVTIVNPKNPKLGQLYTWDISNNSGSAMGKVDFGRDFLTQGQFVPPANAKRRTITFRRINSRFIEIARNLVDVS